MDRFVAMLWDADAGGGVAAKAAAHARSLDLASSHWTLALEAPGVRVLAAGSLSGGPALARFDDGGGVVIGRVFARGEESAGPLNSLTAEEAGHIRESNGARLIDRYWGNYLAIWRTEASGDCVILRDPCGAVPCFMARLAGIDLVFSCIEDVCDFQGFVFAPDWAFIKSFLLFNYFATRFTGVAGVEEVQPGQRLLRTSGGALSRSWAWSASTFAHRRTTYDFEAARVQVRKTASACFAGWGRAYRRPLVQLSGGLDSSVVLGLLCACSDAEVRAIHLVGGAHDASERDLARLAANRAGVSLIEVESRMHEHDLAAIIGLAPMARPSKQILGLHADSLIAAAADAANADCTMAGHGGDALFIQRSGAGHVLDDFVKERGLGPGFLRVAYHTAMLLEQSVWRVASDAVRSPFRPPVRPYSFLRDADWTSRRLVRQQAIAELPEEYVSHPWLEGAMKLPPGKSLQLENTLALCNYHAVVGSAVGRDAVMPFFCQPIVELCLQTPTWLFGEGGCDRSLERQAFLDILPDRIARRTGKGLIDNSLLRMIERNLPFLRELTLDGEIARQDWIDRERIERALTPERLLSGTSLEDTLNLVVAEAWLRAWRRR